MFVIVEPASTLVMTVVVAGSILQMVLVFPNEVPFTISPAA